MKSLAVIPSLMGFVTLGIFAAAGSARAQTADCDLGAGQVDLFIHLRFEKFDNCGGATGISCTQDPDEEDLSGWGVTLNPGPGTTGDTGTTDADGEASWNGNGALLNTCVGYGAHSVTFAVPPPPNGYSPAASWPTNLTFPFTINTTNPGGSTVERFFLTVSLGCGCASDGVFCTLETCLNGQCPYPPRPYDPTRPELCNDADDDCDGETDEGLPATAPACNLASSIGCADKTREGFMEWDQYPLIAACGGAWSAGGGPGGDGLFGDPSCNRAAGNHGTNQPGTACHAADLCPAGWHVCYGADDVAQRVGADGCADAVDAHYPNFGSAAVDTPDVTVPPGGAFFASRAQAALIGCDEGVNEGGSANGLASIYGCGNMGASLLPPGCGDFNQQAGPLCGGLRGTELLPNDDPATDFGYALSSEWAWQCGSTIGAEQQNVTKSMPDRQGGVLCCKDTDPTLAEVCDGIDNDGDGDTDESIVGTDGLLEAGQGCHLGAQCGTVVCTPEGGFECASPHACEDTTCDGVDDDADGDTDDDYVAPVTHCGTGACARSGTAECNGGTVNDNCVVGPKPETTDLTCDGQDGDCDGATDEDFVAAASTCGVGACAATGTLTCTSGTPGDTCTPKAPTSATDATCDGIDDDCNGTDDEDVSATPTTCGTGACAATGVTTCSNGVAGDSCTPASKAEATDVTCDGVDGDCDGATDEEFAATATTCGVGACAGNTGATTCTGGVPGDSCDPLAGAVTETCDATDDDCDGETDEGFGVGTACDGDDEDQCLGGTTVCAGGAAACDETGPSQVEVCDGQDNDCDGDTDEGLESSGCTDRDDDDIPDQLDNCVDIANTNQSDKDGDGVGDVCDVLAQGGACAGGDASSWLVALALIMASALVRAARRQRGRSTR